MFRFILCDPEDGLYEDVELDEFDPDIEEKREQLRQDRIDKLFKQVDFNKLVLEIPCEYSQLKWSSV